MPPTSSPSTHRLACSSQASTASALIVAKEAAPDSIVASLNNIQDLCVEQNNELAKLRELRVFVRRLAGLPQEAEGDTPAPDVAGLAGCASRLRQQLSMRDDILHEIRIAVGLP